jgi:6-phosphogluconolactonase (cycloisomerase 2 family)
MLWTFSASIPSGETAACWIAIVGDRFAYTTNTGSNTVSAYEIADAGEIELFGGGGTVVDFGDDHGPIDMALSDDEQYLYVLNAGADNIVGFAVEDDGMLTEIAEAEVPEMAVGLAGF